MTLRDPHGSAGATSNFAKHKQEIAQMGTPQEKPGTPKWLAQDEKDLDQLALTLKEVKQEARAGAQAAGVQMMDPSA